MLSSCSGLPWYSAGKEFTCSVTDLGSIPGSGRSPGEGNGYPLQYSGLENSMDCIVHGVAKSQTWLNDFFFHLHPVVPGQFVRETVLIPLNCFCSFARNQLVVCMWVCFNLPCWFICMYLHQNHAVLITMVICSTWASGRVDPSTLSFFLKIIIAILVPFHIYFRMSLSTS